MPKFDYSLILQAQIDPKTLNWADIKRQIEKDKIKISIDVDPRDTEKIAKATADLRKSLSEQGVSRLKVTQTGESGVLSQAMATYKNSIGQTTTEVYKLREAEKGRMEWFKASTVTIDDATQRERILNKERENGLKTMEKSALYAEKFLERSKGLQQTPQVREATDIAKKIGVAVSDNDLAKTNELTKRLGVLDAGIRQSGHSAWSWQEQVKVAIERTMQWASATTLIYGALQQLRNGVQYIVELNKELVNIQLVTGQSDDNINAMATSYNKLAQEMGATTLEVTRGSLEWIRQGKTQAETQELLKSTLMLSKLGNVDTAQSTEFLTSITNGFKLEATETVDVVNKLVAVDNVAATSVKELATALQRSSVGAQQAGVGFEELVAMIGTVSSVSRRSSETIGEAFKTILVRYQDIKEGRLDEDQMGINNVEDALMRVGIRIRDAEGGFRDFTDVLKELYPVWGKLNEIEQANIAKALAGTRQRETLLILLENQDKFEQYMRVQRQADGLAIERYGVYLEGVEAKQKKFNAALEEMWMNTIKSDSIKFFYELGTTVIQAIDSLGGLPTILSVVTAALILFNAELLYTNILTAKFQIGFLVTQFGEFFTLLRGGAGLTGALTGATSVATAAIASVAAVIIAWGVAYQKMKEMQQITAEGMMSNSSAWTEHITKSKTATDTTNEYIRTLERLNKTYKEQNQLAMLFVNTEEIKRNGLEQTILQIKETATSWNDYKENVLKAAEAAGYLADEEGRLYQIRQGSGGQQVKVYAEDLDILTEAELNGVITMREFGGAMEHVATEYEKFMVNGVVESTARVKEFSTALKDFTGYYKEIETLLGSTDGSNISAQSLEQLSKIFPDYLSYVKEENGLLELNKDKVRETVLAKAQQEYQILKNSKASEQELMAFQAYINEIERANPITRNYSDNYKTVIDSVVSANPKFAETGSAIHNLNVEFEQGTLSSTQYFEQLEEQMLSMDFSSMFGEDQAGGQAFMAGSISNALESLTYLSDQFDAEKISITEYTESLAELSDIFTLLGEMSLDFGEMLGMTDEQISGMSEVVTQALGDIGSATEDLRAMQELNIIVQDAFVQTQQQSLQFGTQAFNDYMMQISQAAEKSGQVYTDMAGNAMTSADQIYKYLTAKDGNFSNFANQSANKTGKLVQKIVQSVGSMMKKLAEGIKSFKGSISITPTQDGFMQFDGSVAGEIMNMIGIPKIKLNIGTEGIDTGAIGNFVSSMGADLENFSLDLDATVYTNEAAMSNAGQQYQNLGDKVGSVANAFNNMGKAAGSASKEAKEDIKSIDKLLDLVVKKLKQEANARKDSLKESLKGYKEVIDTRKKLLDSMEKEEKYQDKLGKKQSDLSNLQNEITELSLDDSEEAIARRMALEEEALALNEDIAQEQSDHSYDLQNEALDAQYDNYKDYVDAQIAEIDRYLAQPGAIMGQAMDIVDAKADTLYSDLINWNSVYGDGINATVTSAWNDAYSALEKYKNSLGQMDSQFTLASIAGATVPTYHSGIDKGVIGNVSKNEQFIKALKGELVVNPQQMNRYMDDVLPTMMRGAADVALNGNAGNLNIEKLMDINIAGNMDKSVIPDLERITNTVIEKLNEVMRNRGNIRQAGQFAY